MFQRIAGGRSNRQICPRALTFRVRHVDGPSGGESGLAGKRLTVSDRVFPRSKAHFAPRLLVARSRSVLQLLANTALSPYAGLALRLPLTEENRRAFPSLQTRLSKRDFTALTLTRSDVAHARQDRQLIMMDDRPNLLCDPVTALPTAQSVHNVIASSATHSQSPTSATASSFNPWWRIADVLVFGVWAVVVGVVQPHHEPWADESIAWLIARDLSLKKIWFHELRYEGSPGLWHTILWIAQHWFHLPFSELGVIGALCAAAGVAFILWKAPFPRPLSYLLIFSYFLVYQYAVVARSYTLMPLLLFSAAYFYRDRSRPFQMTVVLILLANVSAHGTLLAASFGLCYLLEALKDWASLTETLRRRYLFCTAAMLLTFLFLFLILRPTPDVAELASNPSLFQTSKKSGLILKELEQSVTSAFFDQPFLSLLFLLLATGWCYMRRKVLPFVLPVSLMVFLYVAVHGRAHHIGLVFLAAVAGLWVAWPTQSERKTSSYSQRAATHAMSGLLACLFCLNIWDAGIAMRNDYLYPYSGSADAANFLKRVGADRATIFGYTYGMSAVQAYFDHNVLANIPTSYYHDGLPLYGTVMDTRELQAVAPQYVIIYSNQGGSVFKTFDPILGEMGYVLVHFSNGNVFYKRGVAFTDMYYTYRR